MSDPLDVAVRYGIVGGVISGFINWSWSGSPKMEKTDYVKYYMLFGCMGCLGGSLCYALGSATSGIINPRNAGIFGGVVGSYLFLGIGNYG